MQNTWIDAAGQLCAALIWVLNWKCIRTMAGLHKGREFKILLIITSDIQSRIMSFPIHRKSFVKDGKAKVL